MSASGWMATKPSPLVSTPSSGPRMVRPTWTFRIYRHSMVCSSKQIREVSATVPLTVRIRGSARRPACRAWLSSQEAAGPGPRPARPARPAQVTWVVPAAARGAPPPPGAVVEGSVPFAESPALERVGRQVADLQAGELAHEVSEGHPGGRRAEAGHGSQPRHTGTWPGLDAWGLGGTRPREEPD